MLVINSIKNVSLENIKFAANSLVLLKIRERVTSDGSIDVTTNFIEVCDLKDTKDLTIVQSLLKYCLAEFKVSKGFENDFKETNIKQRRILQPFLNTKVIFRTDSDGKISRALLSEVPFTKTALNIQQGHRIVTCEPKFLRAAIFSHSQAILAQCSYLSLIDKEAQTIIDLCKDGAESVTVRKQKSAPKADVKAA
jgi:hypothetical protein